MKFFRKLLISGVIFTSTSLSFASVFAANHIMKIAFVGNTDLTSVIIRKLFDKTENVDASSDVYGIRTIDSENKVWYKFKSSLIADQFEKAVSPACNMIFMVVDFSSAGYSPEDTLTQNIFKLRRLSDGHKIIAIVPNSDCLPGRVFEVLRSANILYSKDNFDYILVPSNQDDQNLRNSFFKATDKVTDWKRLPTLTGEDLAVLHKSDPAGTIISEFFSDMVGIREFKRDLGEMIVRIVQNKRDAERGKARCTHPSYHMLLMGNPGTGKTTIARKMADVFCKAGILPKSKFLQVERKDLVDKYIGHTEDKVKTILKEAEGGVIFIDEAYSLACAGEKDFGKHVIEGLLTAMTDDKCIIIAAGYPGKMQDFLDSNPGLSSRFKYHFTLPDYSDQELFTVFENLVHKNGFELQDAEKNRIYELFVRYFQEQKARLKENFGNARSVESFFELIMNQRAMRLSRHPDILEDFITLDDVINVVEK